MKATRYIACELLGSGLWENYESEFYIKETAKSLVVTPITPSKNDYVFEKTVLRKNRINNRLAIFEISEILVVLYRKDVGSPIRFTKKVWHNNEQKKAALF